MYTDQIVSTYWVSSAQCIPNSQYIVNVQNDAKCMLYNYYENRVIVPQEKDTIRTFRVGLQSHAYCMFQFHQLYQKRYNCLHLYIQYLQSK